MTPIDDTPEGGHFVPAQPPTRTSTRGHRMRRPAQPRTRAVENGSQLVTPQMVDSDQSDPQTRTVPDNGVSFVSYINKPKVARPLRGLATPRSAHNTYLGCREFAVAHHSSALFRREGAALCGVSLRTYQRWMRGDTRAPGAALRLIRLAGPGGLEHLHRDWRGWSLTLKGELVSPYGRILTPGDIDAEPYYRRLSEILKERIAALQAQIEDRGHGDARGEGRAPFTPCLPRSGDPAPAAPTDSTQPRPARRPQTTAQWFSRGDREVDTPAERPKTQHSSTPTQQEEIA